MKYFSLIYADKAAKAPGGKIVPAEEFSHLLEGKELIEKIQSESEQYRKEVIEECERLKEEAERTGFEEGLRQWSEQLALLEKESQSIHDEVKRAVAPLALQATKRVVGRELEVNPEVIVEIVAQSLRAVTTHRKVTIYCNRADLEQLEKGREQLKSHFERIESFNIQERGDIEAGGVVIETEAGIINAQLSNQWRALETAFNQLLGP